MREKLIELLKEADLPIRNGGQLVGFFALEYVEAMYLADHLIANGVTLSAEIEELKADNERLRNMWAKAVSDASKAQSNRVEVVRCKDCRWARKQDHREPTSTPPQSLICQCFMHNHIPAPRGARLAVKPDDFCSYGERKEE